MAGAARELVGAGKERRCFGGGGWARRRSFVAQGAPLDDGQKRLDARTLRLGEADRLNPHPLREATAPRVRHPARAAVEKRRHGRRTPKWAGRGCSFGPSQCFRCGRRALRAGVCGAGDGANRDDVGIEERSLVGARNSCAPLDDGQVRLCDRTIRPGEGDWHEIAGGGC